MRHGTVLDLISKRSLYALYTACMVVPSNFFCEMQTNDFIAGAMMEKVNGIKKDYHMNLKTEKEFYEVRNRKPKSYPIGVVGSGLPQPGAASPGGATTDCSVTSSKEGARKLGGSSTATPQPAHCMLGGSSTATPQPARYGDIGPGVYKADSKNSKKKGIGKLFSTIVTNLMFLNHEFIQ